MHPKYARLIVVDALIDPRVASYRRPSPLIVVPNAESSASFLQGHKVFGDIELDGLTEDRINPVLRKAIDEATALFRGCRRKTLRFKTINPVPTTVPELQLNTNLPISDDVRILVHALTEVAGIDGPVGERAQTALVDFWTALAREDLPEPYGYDLRTESKTGLVKHQFIDPTNPWFNHMDELVHQHYSDDSLNATATALFKEPPARPIWAWAYRKTTPSNPKFKSIEPWKLITVHCSDHAEVLDFLSEELGSGLEYDLVPLSKAVLGSANLSPELPTGSRN